MSESEEEEVISYPNAVEIGHTEPFEDDFEIWDGGKVGGKPIWLNPRELPKCEELICPKCENPLKFLLQLYLPCDDSPDSFHRSLYIFVCNKTSCVYSGGIKILRCQLKQQNDFYPALLNEENENEIHLKSKPSYYNNHICEVCGFPAPYRCSKCRSIYYCSKSHQIFHWKVCHQNECGNENIKRNEISERILKNSLFKEYEIEITNEPYDPNLIKLENQKYEKLIKKEDEIGPDETITKNDINEAMKSVGKTPIKINSYLIEFQNRVSLAPNQIVRICYNINESILWYSDKGILSKSDIPKCKYCGNERVFEFQVMPQILYYLDLNIGKDSDTLQFGTLCVYTCSKNCVSSENAYLEEFIYCQPAEDI